MCGVAGLFSHESIVPEEALLKRLGASMYYRGPDDEGIYRAPHMGLVHRRLSIRDLSPAGRCPMPSPDGVVQVLLNGEIYNWRELRAELQALGHSFLSESDTEVVVHGYLAWGEQLVSRLRGMFAVAIWDAARRQLLLARDRVGEKPLFYRETKAGLEFASTVQGLALMGEEPVVSADALACYLSHSFIPAAHTIYEGVAALPPGHVLVISVGRPASLQRYWEFPREKPVGRSARDCLLEMERVIEDSVVRCLDADVPVGVFLSGGVDSSLVAAMAGRHQRGLPAFSVGFREQEFNELPYAQAAARHAGLAHEFIEIGEEDLIDCLPHLVRQYGQPFGDSSAVPSYLVARLARGRVKVCLSGDGGDESFGGYWRLQAGVYAQRYGRLLPAALRKEVVPRRAPALGGRGRRWLAMNELSLAPAGGAYTNFESWYTCLGTVAGPRLRPGLSHDLVACRTAGSAERLGASAAQRILYEDFQVQLPDDYLTKVDVASMAASLEVRAPFLDQKVIEAAWLLPDRMKLHWGQRKWLLKQIAVRWVPREVVYRPKMGFALPLVHWWRHRLGDWLAELMRDSVAERDGWIQSQAVLRTLDLHRQGENHHTRLWLILWLELWFRLVFNEQLTERTQTR